ncbi:GreA/GreB family elongation factor [Paenibacillus oralis]|uniref:GreA/GreB family elongation factor n=1 Tax=Paenibacillus oralis TaxID=2490856 RepID=A0A3P3U633_9BACL|nr:GreA/GreB family elongation factor [Paenibacillus oralis]
MNPSFKALDGTRTHLVNQLVFFDEQYPFFADTYLLGLTYHDRRMMDALLRKYTAGLISLLANEDTALQEKLHQVVLIGSSVKVEFEEDGSTDLFTVVYPTESDPDNNRISFISPIGRQLLCAECNSPLVLEVPDGTQRIHVREIKYAYIGGFDDQ